MARRVHIVPHTHWDREWYLPFQTFRLRLVEILDELLPRMEADPSYGRFLLDGQLAVVEDYLAVRPEAAGTVRRLVANGRLSIGPWYTLPDEFLVSGETLVRNLQRGLQVAAGFGGAMTAGYLPDMFGHIAQMPQLLRQFGFDQAVVWRGTPAAVDRTGFHWVAPDGSSVRAEYMPEGYGNGAHLPDDAKALVGQIAEFEELWAGLLGDDAPILWMNGTDHQAPQPWLGRVVAEANSIQDDYELVVASLPEHLATVPATGLPTWHGELRSGARANLLMGVTSNRVDVRQAAARAERALERTAEPLAALLMPADQWPRALLDEAWLGVIRNAAHDSVCACSVDEVCDAVLHRYAEATRIAEGLTRRSLRELARRVAHDGPVVVNPSPRERRGLVELTLPGDVAPDGTQLVEAKPAEQVVLEGPVSLVVPGVEEVNWDRDIEAFTLETAGGAELVSAQRDGGALMTSAVRAALAAVDHDGPVRLRVRQRPAATVLASSPVVPGYGWAAWSPPPAGSGGISDPVGVDGLRMANGLVEVEVDPSDGTWSLDGHAGMGRLVDGGDCGDTYNWCPPRHDTLVDVPDAVEVETVEAGPLRARLVVRAHYRWPERSDGLDRRVGEVPHTVATCLELRAGEPFLRVVVTVDNRSRDHRLRSHFPLPEPARVSRAECAFAVVERTPHTEGGPNEPALATYPSRRFVQAGGLTVVHDGVAEHELTDADQLAVTLLRANGMLSQGPMPTRPLPAGPLIPLDGPQLQTRVISSYALATGEVDPYALADEVLVPLQVAQAPGRGAGSEREATGGAPTGGDPTLPPTGQALAVDGAEVSALYRTEGGGLRLRVLNPTGTEATVHLPGRRGWLVDLRDRAEEPFEGHVELRPWGVATLALDE